MRHEVETEDMEVEIDPAPVGVGFDYGVSDANVVGSRVKRDAERSIEDIEAEIEADRASGTPVPMTIDLFLMDDVCQALGPVAWYLEQGLENARARTPELFDAELNSIKFAQGKDYKCVKVKQVVLKCCCGNLMK